LKEESGFLWFLRKAFSLLWLRFRSLKKEWCF